MPHAYVLSTVVSIISLGRDPHHPPRGRCLPANAFPTPHCQSDFQPLGDAGAREEFLLKKAFGQPLSLRAGNGSSSAHQPQGHPRYARQRGQESLPLSDHQGLLSTGISKSQIWTHPLYFYTHVHTHAHTHTHTHTHTPISVGRLSPYRQKM